MSTKGDNYKASGNEGRPGANRWRADTHLLPSCSDVNIQVTARTAHHTYVCLPPAASILPCKSDAPRWAPVHHQQWAGWSSLPAWLVFWQRAVTWRDVAWRAVTCRDALRRRRCIPRWAASTTRKLGQHGEFIYAGLGSYFRCDCFWIDNKVIL